MSFAATMNLSTLNGSNGFRLAGVFPGDQSGTSVASAGDVNGDGFADLIVGALWVSPNGIDRAGASYVVFGRADGWSPTFNLSTLNGSNGFRLEGVAPDDRFGRSVASAGDVNGDGFADLIIGASFADPNGLEDAGSSYVVFGKAGGWTPTINMSTLNGSTGFRLDGVASADGSGVSVASAGDVNRDGFADLIVGATGVDQPGAQNAGASYVVFGKASGWSPTINLSTLNGSNGFRLDGVAASDATGRSVASAGDVNGDGFVDLIIGATLTDQSGSSDVGSSYVVFGKAGGWSSTINLSTLNGTDGFRLDGQVAGDNSGISVASAGDVNGDGFADLIVGAYFAGFSSGVSYVVFGKASGWQPTINLGNLDGANGFQLRGRSFGDLTGNSVASAGDVNKDGFADLIVAAYGADPDGRLDAGSSYVVFGKTSGWSSTINLAELSGRDGFRLDGVNQSDYSGVSVASAGDVNGDGVADLIVGASLADPDGQSEAGSSYVVFGRVAGSTIMGTNGNDILAGTAGPDTISGLPGNDNLSGLGDNDVIDGGTGNDTLNGQGGDDVLSGGDGNDLLLGGAGADLLNGGNGADIAAYWLATAAIALNLQTNAHAGEALGDSFFGIEYWFGSNFDDTVSGADADEWFVGLIGHDSISGQGGRDLLFGGVGNDTLNGGSGNDELWGEAGNDSLDGGAGNDSLHGGAGADALNGGDGADIAAYWSASAGITLNLRTGIHTGEAAGDTFSSIEYWFGTNFNDTLFGGTGDEWLVGLAGADQIAGDSGSDTLFGNEGADFIIGGSGNDFLYGGADRDTFTYTFNISGRDTIFDFNAGGLFDSQSDRIWFRPDSLVTSFSQLVLTADGADLVITANTSVPNDIAIRVLGVTSLTADYFMFGT